MSLAHGGTFALSATPIPARKRKVRDCAVGAETCLVYVCRASDKRRPYNGRDDWRKLPSAQWNALRRLNGRFVGTVPFEGSPLALFPDRKDYAIKPGRWVDTWRVPVRKHTQQSLRILCERFDIAGPDYGIGQVMRTVSAAPGDHGFTEKHLPPAATRRARRAALEKVLRSNGDFPSLLDALQISRAELAAEPWVELKMAVPQWQRFRKDWFALCARQPLVNPLWRLIVRNRAAAKAAYRAAPSAETH